MPLLDRPRRARTAIEMAALAVLSVLALSLDSAENIAGSAGDVLIDTVMPGSVAVNSTEELNLSGHYDEIRVAEDGTRHLIPLDAIDWGGVARDGIPSIDRPDYVGPERWSHMVYDPDGLVIGVEVNGKYRAYPLQILIWHEIVNEAFEGKHLLVTY